MKGFMTVKEAAQKWNVSERQVQLYCQRGILTGVSRIGRSWVIPDDANKPVYMFVSLEDKSANNEHSSGK